MNLLAGYEFGRQDKLPLQIIKKIWDAVLVGQLAPGDKLPSEQKLIEMFSVSRQTVREVLRVLEVQGLLDIRPGISGGAFVQEVGMDVTCQNMVHFLHQTNLSIEHLSEARRLFEPYFVSIAATAMTDEQISNLGSIINEQKYYVEEGDLNAARKAEIKFHRAIAEVSQNPLLLLLLNFIENILEKTKRSLKPGKAFSLDAIHFHSKILEAIRLHDPEMARCCVLEDLNSVENSFKALDASQAGIKWQ